MLISVDGLLTIDGASSDADEIARCLHSGAGGACTPSRWSASVAGAHPCRRRLAARTRDQEVGLPTIADQAGT
ncbi:MAG: hypothetical protein M3394_01065, partial [Actinomycetota bacterium]|nr:hypothetical protein [Actinomycetota bacterium]MDQ3787855.1 hypothetical protein [Actinomycetota bacterium]